MPSPASTSGVSPVEGPRPSRSPTTARTTWWPIQKPEPSSPSSQPDPSETASASPSRTRIAAEPVPATSACPSRSLVPAQYMARRSDSTTKGASMPAADSAAVMDGCSGPSANRTDRAPAIATAAPVIEAGSTPADSVACRTAAPRASAMLSSPEEMGFPLPAVLSPRQRPVESTTTARVDEPRRPLRRVAPARRCCRRRSGGSEPSRRRAYVQSRDPQAPLRPVSGQAPPTVLSSPGSVVTIAIATPATTHRPTITTWGVRDG